MKELRIYFEGDDGLRSGFHAFLREIRAIAESRRWHVRLIAAHGTPAEDYRTHLKLNPHGLNFLVLDSDEPVSGSSANLVRKKGLAGLDTHCIFWMVQVMESWFLADPGALRRHYDGGFSEKALRGNPNVEEIPKTDVLSRLKRATKPTKQGAYEKSHAFQLLGLLDPARVRKAAPNCERMFTTILSKLS